MASKRTTIRDVAGKAGVSASAVSMALRNDHRISEATRDHVLKVADEMGYRPNPMVSALMRQVQRKSVINDAKLAIIAPHGNQEWLMKAAHAYGREVTNAMKSRAKELGYGGIDVFEPDEDNQTDLNHIAKVISHRGIKGALLPPFARADHVDAEYKLEFTDFALVAAGYSQNIRGIHRVTHDQYQIAFRTTDHALNRGYRRIGLAIFEEYEKRTGWHHTGGYSGAVLRYRDAWSNRKAIFYRDRFPAESAKDAFLEWVEKNRLDCIISGLPEDCVVLRESGHQIPGNMGFALLNIPSDQDHTHTGYSGMFHDPKEIGRAAVDLVTAQINRNEYGRPSLPQTVMTRPTWIEGVTLRPA